MTELFEMLEDAMMLDYYIDDDGDYHVTQFRHSDDLNDFLAGADEHDEDQCGKYYRFGETWVAVTQDLGWDE